MKIIAIVLVILLFSAGMLLSQPPGIEWFQAYGGLNWDVGSNVVETPESDFIMVGSTDSFGAGGKDVYLVKIDSEGGIIWTNTFGGMEDDFGRDLCLSPGGGIVLVGASSSFDPEPPYVSDVYVVKANADGEEEWHTTLGGTAVDYGFSIQATSDGGYIVLGGSWSFGGAENMYLIKLDETGNEQWHGSYGLDNCMDLGYSVKQTSDGGYILAGYTVPLMEGSSDFYLVKTDDEGNELWSNTYGGPDEETPQCVEIIPGGFLITGTTENYMQGTSDIFVVKVSPSGDEIWSETYGGPDSEGGKWGIRSQLGGYIIGGFSSSYGQGGTDAYIFKINSDADELWSLPIGGTYDDGCSAIKQSDDVGFMLVGWTCSFGAGESDVYAVRLTSEFIPQCDYIPGDCNHNGVPLELGDAIAMIGMYRGTVDPSYICDCGVDPPGAEFAATADPNGNCVAFELGDVVTEIGAYRGTQQASGCPDCPGSP
jgi:hypothetical protein